MSFRIQIYDDGAGEFLFSEAINDQICTGSGDNFTALSNSAIGPFILPSPLPITKPGLITIQLSNVNAPLNTGNDVANTVEANVALVFAIPKKCKGVCYGGEVRQTQRKGVLS